ncbi:intermembrane lipid transfer protein VPS13D-like [Macrosteles quadrilineatus]|uniref:intermembrane lipid transfer protein VPS13D-like n=1 Tax=Macrosteles quadrilineatus TaxID=74068 RepID=UPI0023E1BC51|nr:intermembrane lipid transfer protein VPS13D-like [Macrosteles quadrilineatus]
MLEGLVAWVLNNYLGKYVENLNTDQLSIALLQGAVELENLPLRKDALRHIGLPIEVRAGFIGKIRLKVPVSQIRSAPWEISIDQLYLVTGPVRLSEWDESVEEQASYEYKLSLLDAIEARWRAETDTNPEYSYYASSYSSWLSYGSSLATSIVENLQLKISDVHFRYEDDQTASGAGLVLGVQIESLTARSCDETWTPGASSRDKSCCFKLLQLANLAVYWDNIPVEQMMGDLAIPELSVAMGKKAADQNHCYLLVPVSAEAQTKRNRSEQPLRSRTQPRIVCDLKFDQVRLTLTDKQFGQMVACIKMLDSVMLSQRYRKHRPTVAVTQDPRAWWRYAYTCITIPRQTWATMHTRAKENIAYVDIYSKLLHTSTASAPLAPDNKELKDKVEWERGFEELRALREVAMTRVRPPPLPEPPDSHSQGRSVLLSWFPQWWGWYSSPTSTNPSLTPEPPPQGAASTTEQSREMTQTLEDEILDALADSVENSTLLKRDTVFGQLNFTINQGTFNLCNENQKSLMELQFEKVRLGLESRPRTGSHCVTVMLGGLSLHDNLTEDSAFPVLISPQSSESAPSGRPARNLPPGLQRLLNQSSEMKEEPLFHFLYEYKPFNSAADFRLQIHSQALDVVYNPGAVKWLIDFFVRPFQTSDPSFRAAARQGYNAMKQRTKQELLRNWDRILQGHQTARKTWDVELAISAPQIFLVEHFNDKNAVLCVIDLGKLHLTNRSPQTMDQRPSVISNTDEETEEAFQTPCSTPPGSEASNSISPLEPVGSPLNQTFDSGASISELAIHHKLYDRYSVDLNELQILVGRVKDNWKFAHLKGTSALHVLDRFSISLQMERRIVYTTDPQFPSLTIAGNLPKLVVHLNEQKIQAICTLLDVISGRGLPSPFRSQEGSPEEEKPVDVVVHRPETNPQPAEISDCSAARLLMLQFSVDQLALEVQSRGRSVAELQVSGVRMSYTKRPFDTSLSLSVHGLLLVDALQTFGPDFELLVASHKHVGMDSVSGSLRDSEPTSPTSPGSPDPLSGRSGFRLLPTTISSAITSALSSLQTDITRAKSPPPPNLLYASSPPPIASPRPPLLATPLLGDVTVTSEALITIELVFVSADCPSNTDTRENLQIANIQFNNLDIIANQETIVELIGFVKRVFPSKPNHHKPPIPIAPEDEVDALSGSEATSRRSSGVVIPSTRTQLTFDFHRLNILLLRAVVRDNVIVGRKVATVTLSHAKINASVGDQLMIEGSLGGLQVLDLTQTGRTHQRILSLGQDPLTDSLDPPLDLMAHLSADLYSMAGTPTPSLSYQEKEAFSFTLQRDLHSQSDSAAISIRFASVWYTHSPHLLLELQSCAKEFKQYLANLARSIGSAATEMAIGLVHARAESLAQSLSMSGRLYGSSTDISSTPRKRRRSSLSQSIEMLDSGQITNTRGTATPFTPEDDLLRTQIKWDVILDTPVVVVPRSADSTEVLVAHLGRMSLTNGTPEPQSCWVDDSDTNEHYNIEIRDMNVYTLDIQKHLSEGQMMQRVDKLYSCAESGKPVLHDTVIQLTVDHQAGQLYMRQAESILLESGPEFTSAERQNTVQIRANVVTPLKVSLTRQQYEQVLETVAYVLSGQSAAVSEQSEQNGHSDRPLQDIEEDTELTGVTTLNLDPKLRARMYMNTSANQELRQQSSFILRASMDLPVLTVELIADLGSGEQGLVDLSFKDLQIQYDKSHPLETNIQMSLRSLLMEDLLQAPDSKYRRIMASSQTSAAPHHSNHVSQSCPNLAAVLHPGSGSQMHISLPDHLETENVYGSKYHHDTQTSSSKRTTKPTVTTEGLYPSTPPPSPRATASPCGYSEDNLVHINMVLRAPRHPALNNSKCVTIDFNSLDVVVNVESWVVVLDFFGISSTGREPDNKRSPQHPATEAKSVASDKPHVNTEHEIFVRSLSVVFNRADYEVARAVMSQLSARVVAASAGVTETEASVGSLSLVDLTPCHGQLYREKFVTAGLNMVMKKHNTPDPHLIREYDTYLRLDMMSVQYVHTKRFIAELQAFFRQFSQLQRILNGIRSTRQISELEGSGTRLKLEMVAASPVLFLPMSARSGEVLVVDLGKLHVSNRFLMSGSEGTISTPQDNSKGVLLDVMQIQLDHMDLLSGYRVSEVQPNSHVLGSYCITRRGGSLLRDKCHLQLQVERNLMTHIAHSVPDMSIQGTLSTLAATVDLDQYKLIKGLLSYNIGECIDDLTPRETATAPMQEEVNNAWLWNSIHLELVDVSVCLRRGHQTLACINFVKSHLNVDSYSDATQDVDLVSQEILITDTRFLDEPANKRSNIFTNILQPIVMTSEVGTVQAQVHHRRLLDMSKFTILLNNMRLMAILDWWETARDFILENPVNPWPVANNKREEKPANPEAPLPFEMKLNITNSEIVFVEDTSQWDSNAVILKSTTVITYRPLVMEKPLSCNLNHCEMFSCILGMEDETALSIIDPVTVNIEIVLDKGVKTLKAQMVHLSLRLSYHDVRMFSQMLESVPKQTRWARSHSIESPSSTRPANFRSQLVKLSALGFKEEDCVKALETCSGQLDDAALWLTQHALPVVETHGSSEAGYTNRSFTVIEVETDCLSVCIIDDCRDADVPLLELTLGSLAYRQDLAQQSGSANCALHSDYYNRTLSGWEPFIEPWSCSFQWDKTQERQQVYLLSEDVLNINITSTLVELFNSVKETWTQDYYNPKDSARCDSATNLKALGSPPGYRRRSPFVPFALRNDTGSRLWFTTIITSNNTYIDGLENERRNSDRNQQWTAVDPGETIPFSFEERGKMRHRYTHKVTIHQLGVKVEGWQAIDPVTVDRVGVYFRLASPDYSSARSELPQARVVLEVTLEGSARKLVTVRSALQLCNHMSDTVEVKLDNTHIHTGVPLHLTASPGATLSVPLSHAMAQMWVRPLDRAQVPTHYHAFCNRPITWHHVTKPLQDIEELRQCHSNRGNNYKFSVMVKRENYPVDRPPPLAPPLSSVWLQPAHTITLLNALTIVNLLPQELSYNIRDIVKGRIRPGQEAAVHQVDQESQIELHVGLENYPGGGTLVIPPFPAPFTTKLKLLDQSRRRLQLTASVVAQQGCGLRVTISAMFWLVNKTGLPLVFRQEGVATETAGQYEEHEVARMVAPLLFSFVDQDASPTVVARVGSKVHPEGTPQWCQHFRLHPGVQVRRLRVTLWDNRPDLVYMIGIDIRPGRGRYRCTNIVTLSAHYQIHNKSSYRIQFAQLCFATTVSDPGAQATYLSAVPDCSLAFHWPRLDKDLLLCLRLMDVPQCHWSGGFMIDNNNSLHINVRDSSGRMYFLRAEIVLQRATYFIVLTDAVSMPAPIRIDNFSQVAVSFSQTGVQAMSSVRPHCSVPYAFDEPTKAQKLTVVAPGGVSANYDINKLGEGPGLTYENFIYITFTGTFKSVGDTVDPLDVQCQQLVLEVPDGSSCVVLSRKQHGARSQLWRMTGEGQLQHEGSSPPRAPPDKILVLDISGPAPQPSHYVSLVLRRPDKRRKSTQTWRFTDDGRLCCVHNNMCVQAKDGFFGLRQGSEVVLGRSSTLPDGSVPLEQLVSRQRLRPGSGYLTVKVLTDGPTRVLQVTDVKDSRMVAVLEESDWVNVSTNHRPAALLTDDTALLAPKDNKEFQLNVELPCIGVSLVSRQPPEELVYIKLSQIRLSAMWTHEAEMLDACVQDIQVDNQLFKAQCPVVLHVTPPSRSTDPEEVARPALQITGERVPRRHTSNAEIVKHLVVRMKNMSLNVEERLLLKLFAFLGFSGQDEQETADESDFETQRILAEATSAHAKRYYFGSLKLIFCQVRLSVSTSNKLSEQLKVIKRKLGLTLIKFQDAAVDLEPFVKRHIFENSQFLLSSIIKHYKEDLMWQAAIILGSTDFLGNPLGFFSDLTEGVTGLFYEGNVGALFKNVTHGLSNSAAKVSESLSDGLGRVALDDQHEEQRLRIRRGHAGTSRDHLAAGLRGFGFGVLGGVTSVFKQTYEGAANEGIPGFISGLGKGLVGTVTKPVIGFLDLTSEAASAVRITSSNRKSPERTRPPRCVTSGTGLMPLYNQKQSRGQEYLYTINNYDYTELFMAYEVLRSGCEDLRIIISSDIVRVFSGNTFNSFLQVHLRELVSCHPLSLYEGGTTLHYIELAIRVEGALLSQEPVKRPRVRCDTNTIAAWVSQQVNHARAIYIERQHTLMSSAEHQYATED